MGVYVHTIFKISRKRVITGRAGYKTLLLAVYTSFFWLTYIGLKLPVRHTLKFSNDELVKTGKPLQSYLKYRAHL